MHQRINKSCNLQLFADKKPSSTDTPCSSTKTVIKVSTLHLNIRTAGGSATRCNYRWETGGGPAHATCLRQRCLCLNPEARCAPTHASVQKANVKTVSSRLEAVNSSRGNTKFRAGRFYCLTLNWFISFLLRQRAAVFLWILIPNKCINIVLLIVFQAMNK